MKRTGRPRRIASTAVTMCSGIGPDLGAESAPDGRRDHAHLLALESQHSGEILSNPVRRLAGIHAVTPPVSASGTTSAAFGSIGAREPLAGCGTGPPR